MKVSTTNKEKALAEAARFSGSLQSTRDTAYWIFLCVLFIDHEASTRAFLVSSQRHNWVFVTILVSTLSCPPFNGNGVSAVGRIDQTGIHRLYLLVRGGNLHAYI